jgi:hypothetical protein
MSNVVASNPDAALKLLAQHLPTVVDAASQQGTVIAPGP